MLQFGLINLELVGSKGHYRGLNGPQIRVHPTFEPFCQNTPIINQIVFMLSVIF